MGNSGGITAILPVGPAFDPAQVRTALACLAGQTLAPDTIIVVANGLDPGEHASLDAVLDGAAPLGVPLDPVRLPRPGLAAALNHAIARASTELVARMDADDWCPAHRLDRQAGLMRADPTLAAVGSAWEVVGPDGSLRAVVRPPTDPARLAWTLLLGNTLAHGSMLLRRSALIEVGGYDQTLDRAQDYDLWLRLIRSGHRLGAAGDVLYRHVERADRGVACSSDAQAQAAAAAMLRAWAALPGATSRETDAIRADLAAAMRTDGGGGVAARLEQMLDAGPTREALLALLWARDRYPAQHRRAAEVCRLSRLREVAARIRDAGPRGVWIWGAGQHTRWLTDHAGALGLPILGIVDDHLAGAARHGHDVLAPDRIPPGDHALLSSDYHEDRLWESSLPHQRRGVIVWRLYADGRSPGPESRSESLSALSPGS